MAQPGAPFPRPRRPEANRERVEALLRRIPPRPDVGAAAAAVVVAAAMMALGSSPAAAFIVASIVAIMALPVFLFLREVAVFTPTRVLEPNEAGLVAEWLVAAASSLGIEGVSVFYTYRKGMGLQVVQLSGTPLAPPRQGGEGGAPGPQGALATLIHRAAWNAAPAVMRVGDSVYVAVPARIMELLYSLAGRSMVPYLRLGTRDHVKMVYRLLYGLARASSPMMGRVYAAYLATKAFTKLFVSGMIRVSPEIVDSLDSMLPPEPPWIKRRVMAQIREEAAASLEP